jgi:hypothetical protein
MLSTLGRRWTVTALRYAMLVAVLGTLNACKDSTEPEEEEPEVATMRLTFSNGTVLNVTGAASESRAVRLPLGATTVTATFLKADGTVDQVATAGTFRLAVVSSAGSVTFVQNSSNLFAGTLTIPAAVTNVGVSFALFHIAEGHEDFGPFTVTISAP